VAPSRPTQVRNLPTAGDLRRRLEALGVELPVDDEVLPAPHGPLAASLEVAGRRLANRFAILPMEGWDATAEGAPTELVRRRWQRFGASGAALIWGGEAVAVAAGGRANPHQLCLNDRTAPALADLRGDLVTAHEAAGGDPTALVVGLQLTHSGRWSRPEGAPAPRIAHRHPLLDRRLGLDGAAAEAAVIGDDELDDLVEDYVTAAGHAAAAGFDFVDVKACHGYLVHELLSGWERPGRWGGPALEDRARFLLTVVRRVRAEHPTLLVGVRLSLYDTAPHRPGADGVGEPDWAHGGPDGEPRRFGSTQPVDGGVDLTETVALAGLLSDAGVSMVCATAGSPYTNPHIQRPAYFPPTDGYQPPEDPLVGVARMQAATRTLAAARPELVVVASGLTYLQDHLAAVAQPLVATGTDGSRWADVAGLGRMALSYPELPADVLAGRPLHRRSVCRTFSDCTTAPRNGLVSGCYPLDPFYRERPERVELAAAKRAARPASDEANTHQDDEETP
jgi:NADPH2 dehydrogenase